VKKKITLLVVATCVLPQFCRPAENSDFSASANSNSSEARKVIAEKPRGHWYSFLNGLHFGSGEKDKVERYEEISSRPWTQIVGWHPATPSWEYENAIVHEPQLSLFSANTRWRSK
jgi:hypothetical protein